MAVLRRGGEPATAFFAELKGRPGRANVEFVVDLSNGLQGAVDFRQILHVFHVGLILLKLGALAVELVFRSVHELFSLIHLCFELGQQFAQFEWPSPWPVGRHRYCPTAGPERPAAHRS